jgi:hypothetical protein
LWPLFAESIFNTSCSQPSPIKSQRWSGVLIEYCSRCRYWMEFYETINRGIITANNKARFFLGMNVCCHDPSSFNSIRTRCTSIFVFTVSYSEIFVMLLLNAFSAS